MTGGTLKLWPPAKPLTKNQAIVKKNKRPNVKNVKINPVLSKLVDKRADRRMETKSVQRYSGPITKRGSITGPDWIKILPEVPQSGTAGNPDSTRDTRIGSRIRITSLTVEGVMFITDPASQYGISNTQLIRLFCCSYKSTQNYDVFDAPLATDMADSLLKSGRAIDQYDSSVQNHMIPTNHDSITSHHEKKYKAGTRYVSTHVTPGATTSQACLIPFKFRLKCKDKVLKYDQSSATECNNYAPLFSIGFCDPVLTPSGQVPSTTTMTYQFMTTLNFKDD